MLVIVMLIVVACYSANFLGTAKAAGNVTVSHSGYFEPYLQLYWVAGEVKNVGDTPVTNITVTANFYNATDTFINTSQTTILPGLIGLGPSPWVLMPGSKAPFWPIMLSNQSGSRNVDHYNVTVAFQECASIPVGLQLTLTNVTVIPAYYSGGGSIYVEGTVKNTGTSNATWVYVYATCYDAGGAVIGYEVWDKQNVAANAEVPFHTTTMAFGVNASTQPPVQVASYTVTAESFLQPLYYAAQYGITSDIDGVIPEFPSAICILLLLMATSTVLIFQKRRHS